MPATPDVRQSLSLSFPPSFQSIRSVNPVFKLTLHVSIRDLDIFELQWEARGIEILKCCSSCPIGLGLGLLIPILKVYLD